VYDAWGNCRVLVDVGGIAEVNPFRYRSYYFDEETGLYYLQTRYYDPEVGRFINADSIEYLDPETLGGLNLYAYCSNNPVMDSDPTGCLPEWLRVLLGVLAIAAAVVISVVTAGTAAPVLIGMGVGAVISGGFNVISQLRSGGEFNFGEFLWATFGGAVSGAISAIPIFSGFGVLDYLGTAFIGGIASLVGGVVSGTVTDAASAGIAFGVGVLANVVAKGVQQIRINIKANRIMKIDSNKVRSSKINNFMRKHNITVEGLSGKALGDWSVNIFKTMSASTFKDIVTHALSRSAIVYSAIVSSLLSAWYGND